MTALSLSALQPRNIEAFRKALQFFEDGMVIGVEVVGILTETLYVALLQAVDAFARLRAPGKHVAQLHSGPLAVGHFDYGHYA